MPLTVERARFRGFDLLPRQLDMALFIRYRWSHTVVCFSAVSLLLGGIMSGHSRHFVGLDGLRGVAALIVVFLHGTLFIENTGYIPYAACLAVDFFFLLSGFVVAYAYDDRLAGSTTWRQFMTIRMIRLYPMLFAGTTFGGCLFVLAQFESHEFGAVMTMLLTIGSFALIPVGLIVGTLAYPINIAAWSMFFEFAVNALYGSRLGRLGERNLMALVVVCGAALIPMALWGGPWLLIGFGGPTSFLLGFVRVSYPFWAGVLLFRAFHVRAARDRPIPVIGGMPTVPLSITSVVLALLLLAPVDDPVYDILLVLLVFPAIVMLAASASPGKRTARICTALGRLSYPLYLIHVPVFRMINRLAESRHLDISPWLLIVGGSAVSVVAAEVLLIGFDEPVRKWLSRLRSRRDLREALQAG